MKKVLLLLVCLFTLQTVVWADDDKPIQVNQLPQTAQTFIKTHFPDNKVAMAKMETDWFDKSYDVIFTNGDKLEFDKKGIWTEVNCKYSAVPVAVVPDAIKKYVATNYPDAKMLKIERDKHDYEVKLSNGWEIKFDMQFNVIDIDDVHFVSEVKLCRLAFIAIDTIKEKCPGLPDYARIVKHRFHAKDSLDIL